MTKYSLSEENKTREVETGSLMNQWAAILAVLYDSYLLTQVILR